MRIAQVLTASTGGIGRHVASLLPRFAARGYQVEVFCPEVTAVAQGFHGLAGLRPLSALRRSRAADVVHAHGYKAAALAATATAGARPPLVATWHNAIVPGSGAGSYAAGRLLQAAVARAADLTLGASSDLVAEALRLGARQARLGPVAAPTLPSPSALRTVLRQQCGWRPDEVVVLTVGRLAPQKNLAMVLDIAAAVRDRSGLRFVVVGEGPERDGLQRRIVSERLPVVLLGRQDRVSDLLAAADLALLTSTWEARALVAQEALLAGLPLVATRVGGIPELVGDAAVLVELPDVAAAARAIVGLAGDPVERALLARAGLVRGATWPDEDQVAADVLAAYQDVL